MAAGRNIWTGTLAGYAASRTMDAATTGFYGTSEQGVQGS